MSNAATNNASADVLEAVFQAFNRHDADGVMAYFGDDIVFETIAGDEAHGTRIEGYDAVHAAFNAVWRQFPDVQWSNARSEERV